MTPEVRRTDPPYVQIADHIRKDIASGRLKQGDSIPSARQIAATWGVALATATKVLALLRSEGLVEAVRGVGTVVAAHTSGFGSHERLVSTREGGRIYGADERAEIIAADVVDAPSSVADALVISLGDKVIRRERIVRRGDTPVSSSVSWFRPAYAEVAPRLLETQRIRQGTSAYVEEVSGSRVVRGREQEAAAAATREQAERLGVAEGSPVLISRNWFFTEDGSVLEYGESVRVAGRWSTHEFSLA